MFLAQHREAHEPKLTQEQLGQRFHPAVGKGTVSRWETAKPGDKALTLGVIAAYAEALGKKAEDMYRPPPPKDAAPSLDDVAKEMGVDREAVITVLEALRGRKAG